MPLTPETHVGDASGAAPAPGAWRYTFGNAVGRGHEEQGAVGGKLGIACCPPVAEAGQLPRPPCWRRPCCRCGSCRRRACRGRTRSDRSPTPARGRRATTPDRGRQTRRWSAAAVRRSPGVNRNKIEHAAAHGRERELTCHPATTPGCRSRRRFSNFRSGLAPPGRRCRQSTSTGWPELSAANAKRRLSDAQSPAELRNCKLSKCGSVAVDDELAGGPARSTASATYMSIEKSDFSDR